jgi:membrane-associated protease RseP (regulator of RpoE activity)
LRVTVEQARAQGDLALGLALLHGPIVSDILDAMTRVLAIVFLLGVSRVYADPISAQDYQDAIKALAEQADEPVGLLAIARSPRLGLDKGDLVTAINGESALTSGGFGPLSHDSAMQVLTVIRGKKEFAVIVHLKLADQTTHVEHDRFIEALDYGKQWANNGSTSYDYLTVTKNGTPTGVLVRLAMYFGTEYPAHGDIIRRIDGKAVTTSTEVAAAYDSLRDKPQFTMELERFGQPFKVTFVIDSPDPAIAAALASIKKINDTTYEVPKVVVDSVLSNPMAVAKGARVVPAVKDGKPAGFKLYAIRPGSIYALLGLSNGDTLVSVNDLELTSADKALEAYTKLRDAKKLKVVIERKGASVTITYTIK